MFRNEKLCEKVNMEGLILFSNLYGLESDMRGGLSQSTVPDGGTHQAVSSPNVCALNWIHFLIISSISIRKQKLIKLCQ